MDENRIIMALKVGYGFFRLTRRFVENGKEVHPAVFNVTEAELKEALESMIGPVDDQEILLDVGVWLRGRAEEE